MCRYTYIYTFCLKLKKASNVIEKKTKSILFGRKHKVKKCKP